MIDPSSSPTVAPGGRVRSPLGARTAWLVLMLIACAVPVLVSWKVFPSGSPDRDDGGYLSQADALGEGMLTLPADTHEPFFRPFLSGLEGDEIIFKYQPVWPALIAVGTTLTGSPRAALAVTGLASTLAVAALALEVTRRRRVAWMAGLLFATSPWFIIQSGTYLAYPVTVALLAAATALTLRGVRTMSVGLMVAAGAVFGLGMFHRPYDAILGGLPVLVWLAAETGWCRHLATRLRAMAAGAAPFGVLMLGYNAAVTGSPLTLPFTLVSPLDRFGFGDRSSLADPGQPGPFDFTAAKAWDTLIDFGASLVNWLPGSLLLLPLIWLGFRALRIAGKRSQAWLTLAQAVVFPIGYFVWWGAANARAYRLQYTLGPFYWFPLLAGAVVLAAAGIDWLATAAPGPMRGRSYRTLAGLAVVALVLTSLLTSGDTIDELELARRNRLEEVAVLQGPEGTANVVIAPLRFHGQLSPPVPVPARLDGPNLVALDPSGGLRRFELMDRFEDRTVADVIEVHAPDLPFDRGRWIQRSLEVRSAMSVPLATRTSLAEPAFIEFDGIRTGIEILDGVAQAELVSDPRYGDFVVAPGQPSVVTVGVGEYELEWLVRINPRTEKVEVLEPPTPFHRYHLPGRSPTAVIEDISEHLVPL